MSKLFFYLGIFLSFLITDNISTKTRKNREVAKKEVVMENVKKNDAQIEYKQN
jgi:hypothetical protein